MTNLSAGGPYWLTGSNVIVSVSGEAVTNVVGKHEIKWIPTPLICTVLIGKPLHPCGAVNPYPAKCETNDVSPDSYIYDWTLGTNPKVPGSGNSFSGTTTVSTPGEYTLAANFKGTVKDCAACTCAASGTTNCIVSKIEIVVDFEDPKTNSVCSGINPFSLKIELNGKIIDFFSGISRLTIDYSKDPLTGADKLKVTYVPSLDELNLTGSNTVKVDINDNVNNPMDQVVKSFQIK